MNSLWIWWSYNHIVLQVHLSWGTNYLWYVWIELWYRKAVAILLMAWQWCLPATTCWTFSILRKLPSPWNLYKGIFMCYRSYGGALTVFNVEDQVLSIHRFVRLSCRGKLVWVISLEPLDTPFKFHNGRNLSSLKTLHISVTIFNTHSVDCCAWERRLFYYWAHRACALGHSAYTKPHTFSVEKGFGRDTVWFWPIEYEEGHGAYADPHTAWLIR